MLKVPLNDDGLRTFIKMWVERDLHERREAHDGFMDGHTCLLLLLL